MSDGGRKSASGAMARQMARMNAESDKASGRPPAGGWASKAGARAGGSSKASVSKVAGQMKSLHVSKSKSPVAAGASVAAPQRVSHTSEASAHSDTDAKYRALACPEAQAARKEQYVEAFQKLKNMSLEDLQVEFIVCIRAQHYKDALMFSEIMLEKDPGNPLVAQFQPLLASMAVQANERLCESSEGSDESGGEDSNEDDVGGEKSAEDGENQSPNPGVEESSESDSDDPETAWMWSETWRTDPDSDDDIASTASTAKINR